MAGYQFLSIRNFYPTHPAVLAEFTSVCPIHFMTKNGEFDVETYAGNLDILEKNIKNRLTEPTNYLADAAQVPVKKGFYPVGTEFAHPLHYVDLLADGEAGNRPDGVVNNETPDYEFPGTRSKRIKEIRYMYKWKDVDLEDIALEEEESDEPEFEFFYGREGQGWVDNGAGWILAAYIENRHGELRPQTTEELTQCVGCHAKVGNTIDAVWSFQRKIPGKEGWADMHYGHYNRSEPEDYPTARLLSRKFRYWRAGRFLPFGGRCRLIWYYVQ
jgi:hypothetical protein